MYSYWRFVFRKQRKAGKVPQVIIWKLELLRGQGWAIPEKDKIK